MDARETIRRALIYAIIDREAMYDGLPNCPEKEEALEEIKAFKKMLKRRYGHKPLRESMEDCTGTTYGNPLDPESRAGSKAKGK